MNDGTNQGLSSNRIRETFDTRVDDGSRPATIFGFVFQAGRTGVSVLTRFCAVIM